MATEVKVPGLGESITSGILAAWHVADGEFVEKDQVIYELETDKITSEGNAEVSGAIKLLAAEGDEVEIGQVIAEIDEEAVPDATSKPETAPEPEAEESRPSESEPKQEETSAAADVPPSPAVRRALHETGVDPATIKGTGKGGRLTKGDVREAAASPAPSSAPSSAPTPAPSTAPRSGGDRETRKKLTPLRRSIANRLVGAQNEAALLTTFNEVDMSAVIGLRKKHQEAFVARHGIKLGFMSFFIKATVHALRTVPSLNARIEGEEIVQNHFYDIGVAVSTDRGLMVPVLRDCDTRGFAGIEGALVEYANKAREGKIAIEDLQGGVFSITNGGVFGSLLSTPIVNPPQSGILGMHTIQERPVAVNGEVVIRPMMYLALTYDHRIVDGREAVTFLVEIKKAVEDPGRLLFDL